MNDTASASIFRILLVEDSPDQSLLLSALLQKLGPFEVVLSQDGMQALRRARAGGFDLVVTDLNLPGIDGFQLTREIKEFSPELPVLATTGYTDPTYVEGAYRAGVDALMTKPVDPEDLEARLRELLPRWRSEGERPVAVLAVGARPADVWMGCGASLAAHRAADHEVILWVVSTGDERERAQARKAAEQLGVRMMTADGVPATPNLEAARKLLERVVADAQPAWTYLPSAADRIDQRRTVHLQMRPVLDHVPTLLGYPTPTASLDFAPRVYRDVSRWMDAKLDALRHFSRESEGEASVDFARAQARYWGRFKHFTEVEPFELLDREAGESDPPAPSDAELPLSIALPPPVMPSAFAGDPLALPSRG